MSEFLFSHLFLLHSHVIESIKEIVMKKAIEKRTLNDNLFQNLFVSPFLVTLDLSSANSLLTDSSLETISKCCTNLMSISLFRCTFSGESLMSVIKRMTCLVSLNLSRTNINDQHLIALSKCATNLNRLVINRNTKLTDEGLIPVIMNCTKLYHLSMSVCRNVSHQYQKEIKKLLISQ